MSLWIMLTIMCISAIVGGFVNYLLPANSQDGRFVKPWWQCIILGFGATLLIPIFLELAQSKLMDKIRFNWAWEATPEKDSLSQKQDTVTITVRYDSTNKLINRDTTPVKKPGAATKASSADEQTDTGKNYLLWAAYCLLAAAAGFRFINMLINNVVKDQKINQLENKNEVLVKENEKRTANSQLSQLQEHRKVTKKLLKEKTEEYKSDAMRNPDKTTDITFPMIPQLPPVLHTDDPQKGRFGGKAVNNNRKLSASVTASSIPNFYKVQLVVESTDPANIPLDTDVIFYIHDSFSPSVFSYSPAEFIDRKAIEDDILSYGAFTVGVITDNGKTLLELDLAEDKRFPEEFRKR